MAPASTPVSNAATTALLGGVAWLIAAAITFYLAYQQWSVAQTLGSLGLDDGGLTGYAAWNAFAGAVTLYFGARLLTNPTRKQLDRSAAWAILSVLGGVLQLATGSGNDVFVFSTIAAAAAGVLSYVARQALPDAATTSQPGPTTWAPTGTASPVSPVSPVPPVSPLHSTPPPAGKGFGTAERLVIVGIVIVLLGGAALLYPRMQVNEVLSDVASAFPTARPTSAPVITPAPAITGTGVITFGTSYDPDTLEIAKPLSRFKRTFAEIAWSADLTRPLGATSVLWVFASQSASGVESVLWSTEVDVADPSFQIFANAIDLAALANNEAGTYVMRYIDSGEVLAEGSFRLVP